MKQTIRNKVKRILHESGVGDHILFYSSLLDQLYIIYILIAFGAMMLVAHLSIWPILVLIIYIIVAYLFGAYRNYSVALSSAKLIIINGRTPFVSMKQFDLTSIEQLSIGKNLHPILDRIFVIPSNVYIELAMKDGNKHYYYTNIDFALDARKYELSLEDLVLELNAKGVKASILNENEWYD